MYGFEIKRIIGRYNVGDEISVLTYDYGRVNGNILDYDDDYVHIKTNDTTLKIDYNDISDI